MIYKRQIALLFLVALAVAVATPGVVWATTLSNSQEPGSVLVFPLFESGSVTVADAPYGATSHPKSSFEVSVVCPTGATCTDQQDVDIKFEWVCPGVSTFPFRVCSERNFILNTTVNGTIRFDPTSTTCQPIATPLDPQGCGTVARPQCPEGYLIGWVVNESGTPIKFDGLLGDAVLREVSGGVSAYNAIPIQAGTALATGASTSDGTPALEFDGTHYQTVTGTIIGSVPLDFINPMTSADQDTTSIILLTLDTLSNRFNYPVDLDLNFYNEREEVQSDHFQFTCFGDTGPLFPSFGLESSFSPDTLKALVQSSKTVKTPVAGISDTAGPVTLLGLVLTREFDPINGTELRHTTYPLLNDSSPVDTDFVF